MVFKVSVIAGRFLAVYFLNSLIPSGSEYADATFLALWFLLFAAVDSIAITLLLFARRAQFLVWALYYSAAWSVLLAMEQVALSDNLQQLDPCAQILISSALLLGLLAGSFQWRSKPQSSSLRY